MDFAWVFLLSQGWMKVQTLGRRQTLQFNLTRHLCFRLLYQPCVWRGLFKLFPPPAKHRRRQRRKSQFCCIIHRAQCFFLLHICLQYFRRRLWATLCLCSGSPWLPNPSVRAHLTLPLQPHREKQNATRAERRLRSLICDASNLELWAAESKVRRARGQTPRSCAELGWFFWKI